MQIKPVSIKPAFQVLFITFVLSSCSKKKDIPEPTSNLITVNIGSKAYLTAKIGSQRWTTENYAGQGGQALEAAKNRPEYGKLYSYEEAKAIVLPEGWRVPSPEDYRKMCTANGMTLPEKGNVEQLELVEKLMSKSPVWIHGIGTNGSGFNAAPNGYLYFDLAVGQGVSAKLMTSEKKGNVTTYFHVTKYPGSTTAGLRSVSTPESTGLRFVKDEE